MNPHDQLLRKVRPDLFLYKEEEKRGREFVAICIFILIGAAIVAVGWVAGLEWWIAAGAIKIIILNYLFALLSPLSMALLIGTTIVILWHRRRDRKFSPGRQP